MKKLFLSLCVIVAVSFTACGGSAKTESTETTTETAAPAEAVADTKVFDEYVALLKKSAEYAKKSQAGDVSVVTEMVEHAEKLTKFAEENADAIKNFTEAQALELAKIGEDMAADVAK